MDSDTNEAELIMRHVSETIYEIQFLFNRFSSSLGIKRQLLHQVGSCEVKIPFALVNLHSHFLKHKIKVFP